jgi:hypothetical protein
MGVDRTRDMLISKIDVRCEGAVRSKLLSILTCIEVCIYAQC